MRDEGILLILIWSSVLLPWFMVADSRSYARKFERERLIQSCMHSAITRLQAPRKILRPRITIWNHNICEFTHFTQLWSWACFSYFPTQQTQAHVRRVALSRMPAYITHCCVRMAYAQLRECVRVCVCSVRALKAGKLAAYFIRVIFYVAEKQIY